MTDSEHEQIVYLDPAKVLADDNTRFNLKASRVQSLKDSILSQGLILEPVEVEELEGDKLHTHRLTSGFYRHAAAKSLNTEEKMGLLLPCIVRDHLEGAARTQRQLAENMERENQSPMDRAVAIRKLLDQEVPRVEIRKIFSVTGGRKGNQTSPMSNAMMNIYLNLLDLPKTIQAKIHDGLIGVEGAYMLGRVPPDKRAAVLERAEAARIAQITMDEKEEARFLESERKAAEATARVGELVQSAEDIKADVLKAEALVLEKTKEHTRLRNALLASDTPATKEEVEVVNAAAQDVKSAQKLKKDATNKLAKTLTDKNKAEELAASHRKKLEEARKAKKKGANGKPLGKSDVAKAAKEEGTKAGFVPLNINDIRQTLKDFVNGKEGADDRVAMIATLFKACFDGKDTPKETAHNVGALLDEMGAILPKRPAPAPAKPPAAPLVKQGPKAK